MSLTALVFDWAGTIVDHGSRAPMGAFVRAFEHFNVPISVAEARGPMGLAKRDHIKALLDTPAINRRWRAVHGTAPTERDIDRILEVFLPLNIEVVTDYADLIPGALETFANARGRGLKIGSTTGYTREIMDRLEPAARAQGLAVDSLVCAGETKTGRPSPLMMLETFRKLGVGSAYSVVKIDDTEAGIGEGLSAGAWTVAVALTGNAMGLSRDELARLSAEEIESQRARITRQMLGAGAHYVIDSVADLHRILDAIERRLERGDRPQPLT